MAKANYSNKELKSIAKLGYYPKSEGVPSEISVDPEVNARYESYKVKSNKEVLDELMPGYFGATETAGGFDQAEEVIADNDGKYRKYITRRNKQGDILSKSLATDDEGISIDDVVAGKKENPLFKQYQTEQLRKQIYKDIDPTTGDFKGDIHKSVIQSGWEGNPFYYVDQMVGGKVTDMLNSAMANVKVNDEGIFYGGKKLDLSVEEQNIMNEWYGKKQAMPDGFGEMFSSVALNMLLATPFFYAGGIAGSAILRGIVPGMQAASGLLPRLTNHIAQNVAMLTIADTTKLMHHTANGGTEALADDIKNIAEFSVMAGGFGTIGDYVGIGASKLLGKPKFLQLNQVTNFLRRNPQIATKLAGTATSGLLGYATGGETTEERLATGLAFASMHLMTKEGWRSYLKGDKKAVMVDKVDFETMKAGVKDGVPIEQILKERGITSENYYEREGDNLFRINPDDFMVKGEINRVSEQPIVLDKTTAQSYKYISEVVPLARISLKQALREGKVQQIQKDIMSKMEANPYDKEKQPDKYEEFEMGKFALSAQIASNIYANKLTSIFAKGQLPDTPQLDNMMVKLSNDWSLPYKDVKKYVNQSLSEFLTDPIAFKRNMFVQQGGSLLPDLMSKKYYDDLYNAVKTGADAVAKASQTKLLTKHKTQLLQPSTAPTEGRTYYDHNGELIPVDVMSNGKVKMGNTEFTPKPEKILTEKQAKAKLTGEVIEKPVKGDTVTWESDGKEWTGEVTAIEDTGAMVKRNDGKVVGINTTMIKSVKKAELPKVTNEPQPIPKTTSTDVQGEPNVPEGDISIGESTKTPPSPTVATSEQTPTSEAIIPTKVEDAVNAIDKVKTSTGKSYEDAKTEVDKISEQLNKRLPSKSKEVTQQKLDDAKRDTKVLLLDAADVKLPRIAAVMDSDVKSVRNILRKYKNGVDNYSESANKILKDAGIKDYIEQVKAEKAKVSTDVKNEQLVNAGGLSKPTVVSEEVSPEIQDVINESQKTPWLTPDKIAKEKFRTSQDESILPEQYVAQRTPEEMKLSKGEKIREEAGKANVKLNETEVAKAVFDSLTDVNGKSLALTKENIDNAVEVADLTPQEGALLRKSIDGQKLPPEDLTKDKKLKVAIAVSENMGKGLTFDEAINETVESGGITAKEAESYKALYPKTQLAELFNTTNFADQPVDKAEFDAGLKKMLPGVKLKVVHDAVIDQTGVEPGKVRTGYTKILPDRTVEIGLATLTGKGAPLEETVHAGLLLASKGDGVAVDKYLKHLGSDGIEGSESWVNAHETLRERLVEFKQGYRPDEYGMLSKVKEVWEKLKNFFTGHGMYSSAEIYRKLLDGDMAFGKIARGMEKQKQSNVWTPIMDFNTLGMLGGMHGTGSGDAVRRGQVFNNVWDNKLRYEIDDSNAKFKADWDNLPLNEVKQFSDVINHPELEKEYLNIQGSLPDPYNGGMLKFEKTDKMRGNSANQAEFDPLTNTVRVRDGLGEKHALSLALHEVQHWIQYVEGFIKGAGGNIFDGLSGTDKRKFIDSYLRPLLPKLQSELNYDRENIKTITDKNTKIKYAEMIREESNLINAILNPHTITNDMVNKLGKSYELYRSVAGELEAFDVSSRQHLTVEQRAKIKPYKSQQKWVDKAVVKSDAVEIASLYNTADIPPNMTAREFFNKKDKTPEERKLANEILDRKVNEFSPAVEPSKVASLAKSAEPIRKSLDHMLGVTTKWTWDLSQPLQLFNKLSQERGGVTAEFLGKLQRTFNGVNARAMRMSKYQNDALNGILTKVNKAFSPEEKNDLKVLAQYLSEGHEGLPERNMISDWVKNMEDTGGNRIKWNDNHGKVFTTELNKVSDRVWDTLKELEVNEATKQATAVETFKEQMYKDWHGTIRKLLQLRPDEYSLMGIDEAIASQLRGAKYRTMVNPYVIANEVIKKMPDALQNYFGKEIMTFDELKKLTNKTAMQKVYAMNTIDGKEVNDRRFNSDRKKVIQQIKEYQNNLKLNADEKTLRMLLDRSINMDIDVAETKTAEFEKANDFKLGEMSYDDLFNNVSTKEVLPNQTDYKYSNYIDYMAKEDGKYHFTKSYIPSTLANEKIVLRLQKEVTGEDGLTKSMNTIFREHHTSQIEAQKAIDEIMANEDGFLNMLKRKGHLSDTEIAKLKGNLKFDTYNISAETDYLNDLGRNLGYYDFQRIVNQIGANKDSKEIELINNELQRMMLDRRWEERKGVAGGSQEIEDVFQSLKDLNSELNRRNANKYLQLDLSDLNKEYGTQVDTDVRDYAQSWVREKLRTTKAENSLLAAARNITYANIMFNPRQWFTNATGLLSTGLPVLARYHQSRALPELFNNYQQGMRLLKAYKMNEAGKGDMVNLQGEDVPMYEVFARMVKSGSINPVLTEEQLIGETKMQRELYKNTQKIMGFGNIQIEEINRTTALVAGYKIGLREAELLANEGKISPDEVYDYAFNKAQLINAEINIVPDLNTPLALQKSRGVLRTLLKNQYMLKSFTHNYMHMYSQSLKYGVVEGIKGSDKFNKGQLWSFAYANLPMLMLAGVGGLPFSTDMQNIVRSVFKKDTEAEMRKFMSTLPGLLSSPEFGDLMMNGMPTTFGVDISKSTGMGDVLAQTGLGEVVDMLTGLNSFKSQQSILGGLKAGVDIPTSTASTLFKMMQGDWKAIAETPPLQSISMIRNLTNAVKQSQLGVQTNRGETLVKPDQLSPYNIGMQALGFNSVKSTNAKEAKTAMDMISGDRSSAVRAFGEKMQDALNDSYKGDSSTKMELIKAIKEWNNDNAEYGKPIMIRNIILSAINKIKNDKKALKEKGGSKYMKYLMSLYNVN